MTIANRGSDTFAVPVMPRGRDGRQGKWPVCKEKGYIDKTARRKNLRECEGPSGDGKRGLRGQGRNGRQQYTF
jgi:hypothetical protein